MTSGMSALPLIAAECCTPVVGTPGQELTHAPQETALSGRIEARTGFRMMPTFPRSTERKRFCAANGAMIIALI
jgi:hypothetical protein